MRPCDRLPIIPYPFYPAYPLLLFPSLLTFSKVLSSSIPSHFAQKSNELLWLSFVFLIHSSQAVGRLVLLSANTISYGSVMLDVLLGSSNTSQLHYHQCYLKVQCWLSTVTLTFLTQAATRQMHKAALQGTLLVTVTCDRLWKWLLVSFWCRDSSYSWVSRSLYPVYLDPDGPGRGVGHSRKVVGE